MREHLDPIDSIGWLLSITVAHITPSSTDADANNLNSHDILT